MSAELAKTLLQGGWMVTAVKHAAPRCVNNNSPFYITTNDVPNFGEDENVKRRVEIYRTTSLPSVYPGVDRWLYDNAMHCIAWIANELNDHRHLIPPEELWYEEGNGRRNVITANKSSSLWKRDAIAGIVDADLQAPSTSAQALSHDSNHDNIHPAFHVEARARKVARRSDKRRRHEETTSSSNAAIPSDLEQNASQEQNTDAESTILSSIVPESDNDASSQNSEEAHSADTKQEGSRGDGSVERYASGESDASVLAEASILDEASLLGDASVAPDSSVADDGSAGEHSISDDNVESATSVQNDDGDDSGDETNPAYSTAPQVSFWQSVRNWMSR
jgi:hypothetical protein